MSSRSNRGGRDIVLASVTTKWPLRKASSTSVAEKPSDEPRGKLRRPRDPTKRKRVRVRPPAYRNPLVVTGRLRSAELKRDLIYEREDETYEEEENA